jgi:hypothetical protein
VRKNFKFPPDVVWSAIQFRDDESPDGHFSQWRACLYLRPDSTLAYILVHAGGDNGPRPLGEPWSRKDGYYSWQQLGGKPRLTYSRPLGQAVVRRCTAEVRADTTD